MTAATYSGHWACSNPSDCPTVMYGHSAELFQGRPGSEDPHRSRAAFTGCELEVSTLSGAFDPPLLGCVDVDWFKSLGWLYIIHICV